MISFTHRLLYPGGKRPQYPLDKRLNAPEQVWMLLRKKYLLSLLGIEPQPSSPSVTILTEISQLLFTVDSKSNTNTVI
jgi:hypothetical protein